MELPATQSMFHKSLHEGRRDKNTGIHLRINGAFPLDPAFQPHSADGKYFLDLIQFLFEGVVGHKAIHRILLITEYEIPEAWQTGFGPYCMNGAQGGINHPSYFVKVRGLLFFSRKHGIIIRAQSRSVSRSFRRNCYI
jgi:hypothetical protein